MILASGRTAAASLLLAILGCAGAGNAPAPELPSLTVSAGPFERRSTPVSVDLAESLPPGRYRLRSPEGQVTPLQVGADGRAFFILDSLPANGVRSYVVESGSTAGAAVAVRQARGSVAFAVAGAPVLVYNATVTALPRVDIDPVFARGGYIHPIYSPEGVVVTGDYPPDHVHHHGIWAAWTRARFEGREVDFWNVADRTGNVLPVGLDSSWTGEVHGGFTARHRYVALAGEAPRDALHEKWTGRVYNVVGNRRAYWLFDLELEQSTASEVPLHLPRYHYGGVAFRGRDSWYGTPNASFLTSGGANREDGNESRARWTHISGRAEGGRRGLAVLSHPENFRHPEPVRIHPNEPYFVWAPSQLGDWSIEPGSPHRVRYRYVVHDGEPNADELDRLWNDFAHPPTVAVSAR